MFELPKHVTIDGIDYVIRSDYRVIIDIEKRNGLPDEDFMHYALKTFYYVIPSDINEAVRFLFRFLQCNKAPSQNGGGKGAKSRVFDFEHDADLFQAAFLAQYGVNLCAVPYLHWFEFMAMFRGLRDDCTLCKVMQYRGADLNGMGKEQKAFYGKMKLLHKLPETEAETQRKLLAKMAFDSGDVSYLMGGK